MRSVNISVNQSCLVKIQNAADFALTKLVIRVGVTVVDYS